MGDVRVFQALSDGTRLEILSVLTAGPINVSKIVAHLGCSQPAVSRHLRVLREASLIRDKRRGKEVEYSINPDVILAAVEHLAGLVPRVPGGATAQTARLNGAGGPEPLAAAARTGGARPRAKARETLRTGTKSRQAPSRDFTSRESDFKVERKAAGMDDFLL